VNVILNFNRAYSPPPGSACNLDFGSPPGDPVPVPGWRGLRKGVGVPYDYLRAPAARATRLPFKKADMSLQRQWDIVSERTNISVAASLTIPWQTAQPVAQSVRVPWVVPPQISKAYQMIWDLSQRIQVGTRVPWEVAQPLARLLALPWQVAQLNRIGVRIVSERALQRSRSAAVRWRAPPLHRYGTRIVWERAARPLFVWPPPDPITPPPPPDPRVYIPPPGDAVLLDFSCPVEHYLGGVPLPFRAFACTPRAPYLRVYVIMSSASLIRLSDGAPVAAASIELAADLESWSWQFSARLRSRAALELVMPGSGAPVAVEATINGHVFTALVESWSESRKHGYSEWTIRGRSLSAVLAAPYSPALTYTESDTFTAHQLADNEMPLTGWVLEWDTVDWLVPPGAYTYRDLPTLGALQQIAGAVGAVVQSHHSDNVLTVLPRYPISPWEWAAADPGVAITADIVTSSASEWQPRPDYNGVYVMGTTQGVSVWVRRTGSAGEQLAPQVSDALITHVDAGTERGRIILAAAGRWSSETIQIPLMPTPQPPGLLLPGALIEVDDGIDTWRGQVLSVRISAQRGDSLIVWQTVEVERWHG